MLTTQNVCKLTHYLGNRDFWKDCIFTKSACAHEMVDWLALASEAGGSIWHQSLALCYSWHRQTENMFHNTVANCGILFISVTLGLELTAQIKTHLFTNLLNKSSEYWKSCSQNKQFIRIKTGSSLRGDCQQVLHPIWRKFVRCKLCC